MPRADRRLDALLYLPSEELVAATIESGDADWSDAVGYVPSELVVARVLEAPSVPVATFRFPPWMTVERTVNERGLRRAAAVVLGALGLSPSSLAASTVTHILILVIVGPWVAASMGGTWSFVPRQPVARTPIERVVYVSRPAPATTPAHREPATRRAVTPRVDSAAIRARQEAMERERRLAHEADVRNAATMEILLSAELGVEQGSGRDIEQLFKLLETEPWLRIQIVGRGARRERMGEPGRREAEAVKRILVNAGIAADRIELAGESACGEREPACGARSLVHIVPLP